MESRRGNKIIVILGPTASGKSDVAIKLASAIGKPASGWKYKGAEIISADSRQVYRGMDIGTGKVLGTWSMEHGAFVSENVPHHLINVADPNEEFNVSHFKKLAEEAIEKILAKKKIPIICGGTGFWIQSVVDDIKLPKVKPDQALRNILRNKPAEKLLAMLKKLDPQRAKTIDVKNKVRLIRAIEVAKALGKVPISSPVNSLRSSKYQFLQIGIDVPREVLNKKIQKRLATRFDEGMIEEIEKLHDPPAGGGISWQRLESFGLEYRWISRFLQDKISFEDMQQKLYYDIIHYAKRQMTWFKKNKRIFWLKDYKEIEKSVEEFLK